MSTIIFSFFFISSMLQQSNYDSILASNITLNNEKVLFCQKEKLLKEFGKPDKIKSITSDFTGEKYRLIYYGKDFFETSSKGLVVSFVLSTDKFRVTSNQFKIGDQDINLKKTFPNSARKMIENDGVQKMRVQIYNEEDAFLLFSVKDKKILGIEIWYNE